MEESVLVPSLVGKQPYTYKPALQSQIMTEHEINEDSDVAVLITDHIKLKRLSPARHKNGQENGLGGWWDTQYGKFDWLAGGGTGV